MGDFGCGDGGWTPIMNINGNKVFPFHVNALKDCFVQVKCNFHFL